MTTKTWPSRARPESFLVPFWIQICAGFGSCFHGILNPFWPQFWFRFGKDLGSDLGQFCIGIPEGIGLECRQHFVRNIWLRPPIFWPRYHTKADLNGPPRWWHEPNISSKMLTAFQRNPFRNFNTKFAQIRTQILAKSEPKLWPKRIQNSLKTRTKTCTNLNTKWGQIW